MKIAVLTGAGISAESGLKTFRDSNGLWEGHDVMSVASPQGFEANPALVLDFYNQRRRQLLEVEPNEAHKAIATLEQTHEVIVITQNVDDLHERAGSKKVMHLHGELLKAKSDKDESYSIEINDDILIGDLCPKGHQMRPDIVWFGEAVPLIENAAEVVEGADAIIIIGTSMQVYPAAGLIQYAKESAQTVYIDPNPAISPTSKIHIIAENATSGVIKAISFLKL
ncbi:SIR2 family NAD-dependent protein deacylase [Patiriisocius marinus]|uniref:SIR2 family NAD-dependent protein deacylase n=1 Tax=Patiriisocius marinus TaxID=1397112 RepID=UPI00232E4308|nr:NAD-dependent deacylase [Patiriisocius marinus]